MPGDAREGSAAISTAVQSLDEAWAAAEAALPEGWRLKGVWLFDGPKPFWRATALSYPRTGGFDEHAEGQTPADALLALAEKLASR